MNQIVSEKKTFNIPGLLGVLLCLGLFATAALFVFGGLGRQDGIQVLIGLATLVLGIVAASGLVIVQPQEGRVIQFFGKYMGTLRDSGLHWTIPLTTKNSISLRLRNFESPRLKVNEADGNPIEIAAIIVWKVIDTAHAVFNVDSLDRFVEKQAESALRTLATKYPYDKHDGHVFSLHGNIHEVNEQLKTYVSESLLDAGIQIVEARISHLAYAPEIAAAMLQRQQAQAIIAARQQIVEGAVGMVDMALKRLAQNRIVELDEERKAAMVSNLLVVLCSERPSQPVLNTGTIY